jgi:hypothetical protein
MKNCVIICCDNNYIPQSIISLKLFEKYNSNYDLYIIGTKIYENYKKLCKKYNINTLEINLKNDFINLNERNQGKQYPIECFYHFYAYKILNNYDYIIKLEPDIYTNKTFDIKYLNNIEYIGGGYNKNHKIKDFSPLMNHYNTLNKYYNLNIQQNRILQGVLIFNVSGLNKINFYENILKYYLHSIKINCQRCGDDSLFGLYQMINPKFIYFINEDFNIVQNICNIKFNNKNLNNINFFHINNNTKYWKNKVKINNNYKKKLYYFKYFNDKFIEFIYNNFELEFIKKYINNIYLNIDNIKLPFYYYNKIDNFGDLITPYYLNNFCDKKDFYFDFNEKSSKILSCGSIMRLCNEKSIVYGSGIRDIDQNINNGIIKIVRGPHTFQNLINKNFYCPPNYGDPGLLLPLYYKPKNIIKKYKLGIIPHYEDYNQVLKLVNNNNYLVINLINKNIEDIINQMLSCEKIISSSLHGLIVSDAYNIPNKWIKFSNKIKGDDTKFHDYFLSVQRKDISYIDCLDYKELPDNILSIVNNVSINFNFNKLNDNMFFNKNGIKNYTKFLFKLSLINETIENNKTIIKNNKNNIKNNRINNKTKRIIIKKKDVLKYDNFLKVNKKTIIIIYNNYNNRTTNFMKVDINKKINYYFIKNYKKYHYILYTYDNIY